MSEENSKNVDESWAKQVEKEREEALNREEVYHQPTFEIFLSSLSMQAMIALGKLENPVTKKTEKNMDQARFLIDTIGILRDKTKNNLTPQEQGLIEASLFNLRIMYVEGKK